MIVTHNLAIGFNTTTLLSDINITIPRTGLTLITGPSGSGKTLLLNTLSLMVPPLSGQLFINHRITKDFSKHDVRLFWKQQCSFIHQKLGIIDEFDLGRNISLIPNYTSRELELIHMLKTVGLQHSLHTRASVLSGGERQRVLIARAIFKDAPIIFADEPTIFLDRESEICMAQLLAQRATQTSVIVASHSPVFTDLATTVVDLRPDHLNAG